MEQTIKTNIFTTVLSNKGIVLTNGAVETLKWIALICMVIDHTNHIFFNGKITVMFDIGRIVFPLFGFILAYNLARPGALERGVFPRILIRIAVAGTIAFPFYAITFKSLGGWWPLNIMFLLLVFVAIVWLLELKNNASIIFYGSILFVIGGAFVEYWWPGLIYCLCAWWYIKNANKLTFLLWVLSTLLLAVVNKNFWAMAAIPLIYLAQYINPNIPRNPKVFYIFYPFHLFVIFIVKHFMFP